MVWIKKRLVLCDRTGLFFAQKIIQFFVETSNFKTDCWIRQIINYCGLKLTLWL